MAAGCSVLRCIQVELLRWIAGGHVGIGRRQPCPRPVAVHPRPTPGSALIQGPPAHLLTPRTRPPLRAGRLPVAPAWGCAAQQHAGGHAA